MINQITAQLRAAGSFDEAHSLIVRPALGGHEIVSGHHRALAASAAGMSEVPCWIRDMSDEDAYMALALENIQSPLTPLEEGLHALKSQMSQRDYAAKVGKGMGAIQPRVQAAAVMTACNHVNTADLSPYWRSLSEIHAAPKWLWKAMVDALVTGSWTVEQTRRKVGEVKEFAPPPSWADADAVSKSVVEGEMSKRAVESFQSALDKCIAELERAQHLDPNWPGTTWLMKDLMGLSRLSDVQEVCARHLGMQAQRVAKARAEEMEETRRKEADAARIARLHENVSLTEWKTLTADQQHALLTEPPAKTGQFNKQDNAAIEWAQFSWNPMTGCQHDCPYCYARDITENAKTASAFPNGFEPTLRPNSLFKPRLMVPPEKAATDTRFRNVFTCSMADLFGRWVPREWIEAVLREIRAAPNWNFLCLTKFPKRMAEFDIPPNAWMGTTVDLQARIPNAEAAFANVKSGVRWLSVEPMLEPLRFKNLDRFHWIVIGGSSRSTQTPEFIPPVAWVIDLVNQARDAGLKVYMKTNLGIQNRILELPFDAPVGDLFGQTAPDVFKYLGKQKDVA